MKTESVCIVHYFVNSSLDFFIFELERLVLLLTPSPPNKKNIKEKAPQLPPNSRLPFGSSHNLLPKRLRDEP